MQYRLPLEVTALQSAHCGVGFAYDEEGLVVAGELGG